MQLDTRADAGHFNTHQLHRRAVMDEADERAGHVFARQHFLNDAILQLGMRRNCGFSGMRQHDCLCASRSQQCGF